MTKIKIQVKGRFLPPYFLNGSDYVSIELLDNGKFKDFPDLSVRLKTQKGSAHRQQKPHKGDVPATESMPKSNLTFLEWTRRVSAEHPDILKHMLNSADLLDRVIAKRIMQNAGGN